MTPIQHLNELELAAFKAKWPGMPYPPPMKNSATGANGLTKCIIKYIKLTGGQAERINTMGRVIDDSRVVENCLGHRYKIGSSKYIPGTGTKGSADISATIKGRAVKIEVKWGKDRQSEAQKVYQANVEMAGGVYYIARTFDEFYKWYNATFL